MAALPASAFSEWEAWLAVDGPEIANDRRAGRLCATVANFNAMMKPKEVLVPSLFFPSLAADEDAAEPEDQSVEDMESAMMAWAERHNRQVARRKIGHGHHC